MRGGQERERDDRSETEREEDSEYNSWTVDIQPTRPSVFRHPALSLSHDEWHLFQRVLYASLRNPIRNSLLDHEMSVTGSSVI